MAKTGRPTKYRDEYAEQARKLCLLGATNDDIAAFFDVGTTTVDRWIADHEPFRCAIKEGRIQADAVVSDRLYSRAIGFEQDEVKVFQYQGEPVIVPVRVRYAPDVTAQIFWLKNRQPDKWRDKQQVEHSGSIETPSLAITVSGDKSETAQ